MSQDESPTNPFALREWDARPTASSYTYDGVGPRLWFGILIAPHLFAWFTLREGVSKRARVVAFAWLGVVLLMVLAVELTGPMASGRSASAAPPRLPSVATNADAITDVHRALKLVVDGKGLSDAKAQFMRVRDDVAKQTDSEFAADIEVDGETTTLMFDASKSKLEAVSLSLPMSWSRRDWLEAMCTWAALPVRMYETPSSPGVREQGCYSKTFMATCVPKLDACMLSFAPGGLKSVPEKRPVD